MAVDIVTVALLTPILIATVGDYAFPLIGVIAQNDSNILVQGVPIELDANGYGLSTATVPVDEGRHEYIVTVQHGLIEQEIPVTVIGKRRPTIAWWLLAVPITALLLSVRVYCTTAQTSTTEQKFSDRKRGRAADDTQE